MISVDHLRFQPTYEELKHRGHHARRGAKAQFSAYLRGIETKQSTTSGPARATRFQPTYEELKQMGWLFGFLVVYLFSAYLRGIETKKAPYSQPTRSFSFQPTYEELKQRFHHLHREKQQVFSLPTRN